MHIKSNLITACDTVGTITYIISQMIIADIKMQETGHNTELVYPVFVLRTFHVP